MRPDGDLPCQVCSPQYDTECKTVQDEKCEIRSVPRLSSLLSGGGDLFSGGGDWNMSFGGGGGGYQLYVGGALVPQIVSTSYMLMDQVRGQVRDEIRDQVRNTVRLGLQWCAGEKQDQSQHIDLSCFVIVIIVVVVINAIQDPILLLTVLSSSYSSS